MTDAQRDFLQHIKIMCKYWNDLPDYDEFTGTTKTRLDRLEGMAFSILVALDGGAGGLPGYEVRPLDNKKEDISGALHELFQTL